MADFKRITGQTQDRKTQLAARIQAIVRRTVAKAPVGQIDTVLRALGKFLASFGPKAENLMRISSKQLAAQDTTQANKMKSQALAEITAQSSKNLKLILSKYKEGVIDLSQLRKGTQDLLRQQTLASAIVGVGGVGNLTENVLTAVRRQLTEQFTFLDGFLKDISTRNITQRDQSRIAMYANTTYAAASIAQRQFSYDTLIREEMGLEERRLLGGSEQCDDCIELANEGWQPIGTLPAIGQGTVCGNNCHCTFEFRPVSSDAGAGSKADSAPVSSS